jgi:hypothetical protein
MSDGTVTDEKYPRSGILNSRDACDRCGDGKYPRSLIRYSRFAEGQFCHSCYQAVRRAALHCEPVPMLCASCGQSFTPIRSDARYCSARCRQRAHRSQTAVAIKCSLVSAKELRENAQELRVGVSETGQKYNEALRTKSDSLRLT